MAETDDWVAFGTEFRALATLPGIDARAHLGAGAGDRLRLEPELLTWRARPRLRKPRTAPARNSTLDLARLSVREVNQLLHDADGGDFLIENPRGLHAIAAGLDGAVQRHHRRPRRLLLRRHEQAGLRHHQRQRRHRRRREHDVGPRAREGRRLAVGGRDGLRRPADRRRQRLGALRHLAQGPRHRRQGLGRPHVGVHGAGRQPGGARRRRRGAGRLHLRGAALRARAAEEPRRRLRRQGHAASSTRRRCASCSMRRASAARSTWRSSAATARRGSSTISTSTTSGSTDEQRRSLDAHAAAQVGDLRRACDRRDPPRRGDRHLRHPRLRGEAQAAALRRPAVSRRLHQPLSARGLSREVRRPT